MELGQSLEDYLEAIYILSKTQKVRNIDIAERLGYTKASCCVGVKNLQKKGYAGKGIHNSVVLTEKGRTLAEKLYSRHKYYTELLIRAGVSPEKAEEEGCMLEHVLSDDSHEKLVRYMECQSLGV